MLSAYPLLHFFLVTLGVLLLSAGVLHLLARFGAPGKRICDALAAAPLLDLVVFYFTHGPWIAAYVFWRYCPTGACTCCFLAVFVTAIAAQACTLIIWSWLHELARGGFRGPRIVSTLNRKVGWFRNHAAVWWTALAVPIFTLVRVGELIVYPPLTWLVRLPKYCTRDWVNVSRHKFDGLVGYDLIWCLYCDWMTGVWSLGSEMLRNVESFWCPIRFSSPEKCENCRTDFPDVATTWVASTSANPPGSMEQVTTLLANKYPGPGGVNAWFGHPVRLTVEGKDPTKRT